MARGPRLAFFAAVEEVDEAGGWRCCRDCAQPIVPVREMAISVAIARRADLRYKYCVMETNKKAPAFTLNDENGNPVSLEQFRGKHVVLFFYPKANTPG